MQKYNESVDLEQVVAAEFTQQLHAYKEAQAKKDKVTLHADAR
jgi:hypothetical protein